MKSLPSVDFDLEEEFHRSRGRCCESLDRHSPTQVLDFCGIVKLLGQGMNIRARAAMSLLEMFESCTFSLDF
jgi:hypothetical protein